jgi:hypothetical protein
VSKESVMKRINMLCNQTGLKCGEAPKTLRNVDIISFKNNLREGEMQKLSDQMVQLCFPSKDSFSCPLLKITT